MERPAPSAEHAAVVAAGSEDPGEGCAPPVVVVGEGRLGVASYGGEGVSGAVRKAELELADGAHQKHMADLMPDPARVGRDAKRLRLRAPGIAGVPDMASAGPKVGEC